MPVLPEGQRMWIAYIGEIDSIEIVEKGTGGHVFKRGSKPKNPYVVHDGEEEFVISYDDLYDSPRDATIAATALANEHGVALAANPVEEDKSKDAEDTVENAEEDPPEDAEDGEETTEEDEGEGGEEE